MRKLLLLLPLILATPVLADSDPFGLNRDAYRRFSQHFVNFYQFASVQDWEMAYSELRMANAVLKTNFRQLQQQRYLPDADPAGVEPDGQPVALPTPGQQHADEEYHSH